MAGGRGVLVSWRDPQTTHPVLAPLFGALREAGRGPSNLHRVLANAPEFYEGFLRFGVVLRAPGLVQPGHLSPDRAVTRGSRPYRRIRFTSSSLSGGRSSAPIAKAERR